MASSHIVNPLVVPTLLWPRVPDLIKDNSICPICLIHWGLERGWTIGSCGHVVHPNYLVPIMMNTCCCLQLKVPLHHRLYKEFGIQREMPLDFECNNTHNVLPAKYGDPLVIASKHTCTSKTFEATL